MKRLLKDCIFILFIVVLMIILSDQPSFSFSRSLKFVQLTDIHYSLVREDNGYKLLSQTKPLLMDAIGQINKQSNIDFVMITGDGIDIPNKESICALTDDLNTLKYPWYYVIGNHDTVTDGYLTKRNIVKILNEKNDSYKFDRTYYSFKPKKGFKVIVLDGAKNKGISSNGIIPKEELNWLDEELDKAKKDEVILIFIHFPIYPPYDSRHHEIKNVEEVKEVLDKYKNPIGIFSGHYHMTKITKRGNIVHVSTPSLAGYPNAFRIVEVINRTKEVIFKIELKETGLKELQKKTKIMSLGGTIYYGKPQDRTTTITINKKK